MAKPKRFIPPASHRRASWLAMIPLLGTILFYVLLQQTSLRIGVVALALCLPLMLVVYRTEAQMMPSLRTFQCFAVAACAIAVVSLCALIGYELWGVYAYELGSGAGVDGQSFWQFASDSLSRATVWSDYMGEIVWGLVATIVGVVAAYVWFINSEKSAY